MPRVNIRRAKEIFDFGWQLPAAERPAFLARECGPDLELARIVTRLFVSAARSASRFEPATPSGPEPLPESIGPYRIEARIGSGGMGTVFLGRDPRLCDREVAVKLLDVGVGGEDVMRRFERERRLLAGMEHPAIARLLDVGVDDHDRPWFAMELVAGVALTTYTADQRLDLRARLRLFLDLCDGVEYAHQRGVLHRDLKPDNILVTEVDGAPRCKLIDFGIARAMNRESLAHTFFTQSGHTIGTPDYMSPEQADPLDQDVDSRSDVYSLGVVLFELLTGRVPRSFAAGDGGWLEAMRSLREEEAPRARSMDPRIDPDLDQVCRKALAMHREDRYQSVRALRDDVERFLRHEPVRAAPPSRLRALRRFARRHRLIVGSAVVLITALALALVATLWALHRADSASRELDLAQREGWRIEDPLVLEAQLDSAGDAWPRAGTLAENLAWIAAWLQRTDELGEHLAEHRTFVATHPDAESAARLAAMFELLPALDRAREDVAARAATLEQHWPLWEICAQSIAASDAFGGLRIEPLPGLLPLGIDLDRTPIGPRTGFPLWVFFAPATGETPAWTDDQGHAAQLGGPGYADISDRTAVVMVLVPGGSFQRGAQHDDPAAPGWDPSKLPDTNLADETPVYHCDVGPLLIARTEVTKAQMLRYLDARRIASDPSDRATAPGIRSPSNRPLMATQPRLPESGAEWSQARDFCTWLGFELPSETQWEYCCRAGTTTSYWSGDTAVDGQAVGWTQADEPWVARPVASKTIDGRRTPNPWGLYDMHGSVWEWCADLLRHRYDGSLRDGSAALVHTDAVPWDVPGHWRTHRIARGGSWNWRLEDARAANRVGMPPGRIPGDVGFRPVLTLGGRRR